MIVRIRCFASVRELFGTDVLTLEVPEGTTLDGVRRLLERREPDFARLETARAVNRAYAEGDRVLADGDEVAFIPPISGGVRGGGDAQDGRGAEDGGAPHGVPRFAMTFWHEPIDAHPLEAAVRNDTDGAVVTFAGVTRNHNDGARVHGLEYEAYQEMALAEMQRVFDEVAGRHGDSFGRARVAHRLGPVPIGETSVLVVVASPHRGPAFEVARELMDELKKRVPIFKRERLADGPDGSARWIGDLPTG